MEGQIKKFIEDTLGRKLPSSVDRAVTNGDIIEFFQKLRPDAHFEREQVSKHGMQKTSNIQHFNNACVEVFGLAPQDKAKAMPDPDAKCIKQILDNLYHIIRVAQNQGYTTLELTPAAELPKATESEVVRAAAIMADEEPPPPEEIPIPPPEEKEPEPEPKPEPEPEPEPEKEPEPEPKPEPEPEPEPKPEPQPQPQPKPESEPAPVVTKRAAEPEPAPASSSSSTKKEQEAKPDTTQSAPAQTASNGSCNKILIIIVAIIVLLFILK